MNKGVSGGRSGMRAEHLCGLLESDGFVRAVCAVLKDVMAHGHTDTQRGAQKTATAIRRTMVTAALQPLSKPKRQQKKGEGAAAEAATKRKCRTFAVTMVITQVLLQMVGGDYQKKLHHICKPYVTTSDPDATKSTAMMMQLYLDGTVTEARVAMAERDEEEMRGEGDGGKDGQDAMRSTRRCQDAVLCNK